MDPKANTLVTFSLAPGWYVSFDYSKALAFHGKLIANGFTITQAGQTVVEAESESVGEVANDPAAFQPQIGALHGLQSPEVKLTDVELLASSNASLNETALSYTSQWKGGMMGQETEPGGTLQSHEVLLTLRYGNRPRK